MVLETYPLKFIVGMILLFTNQPVGWGGALLCAYLGRKTGKKVFYVSGTAVYALSWVMLAAGAVLVGPGQMHLVKGAFAAHRWASISLFAVIITGAVWYAFSKKKKGQKNIPAVPADKA